MSRELLRNPDLVWRDEPDQRDAIIGAMERGEEKDEAGWVIVVDGGEIHQLNLVAGDIWMLCDGTRDEAAITAELMKVYEADFALLTIDVGAFTEDCLKKGWLTRKD